MDKSKSQQKREVVMGANVNNNVNKTAPVVAIDQQHVNKPTHRYYCDACTGNAGVSSIPEAVKQITCVVCGKTQICKKENWLKL